MKTFLRYSLVLLTLEFLVVQINLCDPDQTNGSRVSRLLNLAFSLAMIVWIVNLLGKTHQ